MVSSASTHLSPRLRIENSQRLHVEGRKLVLVKVSNARSLSLGEASLAPFHDPPVSAFVK